MIFVTRIDVIIVFLDIGDECQSICNGNTMYGGNNVAGGVIEDCDDDVNSDDYSDDDGHVVIWLS